MLRTATTLHFHHGSSLPDQVLRSLAKQSVLLDMTSWTCRFCNLRLPVHVTHCSQCLRHWKQAQTVSRSKSRRERAKDSNRSKQMTQKPNSKSGAQDETEGVENEELFPSKLPWVNTSPQARMVARGLAEQPQSSTTEETTTAVAAADKVAVPAEQSDPEVLTHLKALKKALGSLPDSLEEQLQSLEAKADKTVTHGQINKLGKLQKQLASLGTKISEMDHNWKVFTDKVMQKFATHQQMYQQCRQQLVADFLQKSQEIQAVKEQVQNASVAMFQAHVTEPPQPVEAVDVDALFEAAQEDAYMDMEQGEEEEDSELVQEKPRPPIGPFRKRLTPVSPTKVHTTHLKK